MIYQAPPSTYPGVEHHKYVTAEERVTPKHGCASMEALLTHCRVLTSGADVPHNWKRTEAVHEAYFAMTRGEEVCVRHGITRFVGPHQISVSAFYMRAEVLYEIQAEGRRATRTLLQCTK